MKVDGIWEPTLPKGFVCPGMFVFTRNDSGASAHGKTLLFNMGRHVPDNAHSCGNFLVQWYLPPTALEVAFKKGPRRHIMDLFGVWSAAESWTLSSAKLPCRRRCWILRLFWRPSRN